MLIASGREGFVNSLIGDLRTQDENKPATKNLGKYLSRHWDEWQEGPKESTSVTCREGEITCDDVFNSTDDQYYLSNHPKILFKN